MPGKPFNLTEKSFGPATCGPESPTRIVTAQDAPEPRKGTPPAIHRQAEADGANLILMTFTPGQVLREHTAAHPITVQTLEGVLEVSVEGEQIRLEQGCLIHMNAMVVHEVSAPSDAPQTNVLLLTMLTGERHSENPLDS